MASRFLCPVCGAGEKWRERRPNGDSMCNNGHKYPSKDAIDQEAEDITALYRDLHRVAELLVDCSGDSAAEAELMSRLHHCLAALDAAGVNAEEVDGE